MRSGDPIRTVRVDQATWDAALEISRAKGESVSVVIRRGLRRYVARNRRSP